MALSDHLRELRARLLRSVLVVVVAFGVALFFYDQLLDLILVPYNDARERLGASVETQAVVNDVTGPLLLQLKLCGVVGDRGLEPLLALPDLGVHPARAARHGAEVVAGSSRPSPGRCSSPASRPATTCCPRRIEVLIGFTPENVTNLVEFGKFFSFITRMLLVFGIAFEIPLFVVMLNLAGVVSGKALGRYRPWIVIGTFVFAAVATPSTDPFSMLFLAVPMLVLFGIAEVIARLVDRARGRGRDSTDAVGRRRGLDAVTSPPVADLDPFDLPDWLGDGPVAWASDQGLGGHLVAGHLTGTPDQVLPVRPARRRPGLPGAGGRRGHSAPASTRPGGTARCCC